MDGAFQAQLRQQQQDLATVFQKMQQLENRVNNLQLITPNPHQPTAAPITTAPTTATTTTPTTTPTPRPVTATTGSTTPNALLQKLQASLSQLDQRVTRLETDYANDIPALKKNMSHLEELVI